MCKIEKSFVERATTIIIIKKEMAEILIPVDLKE
jgi:hypothetical protein